MSAAESRRALLAAALLLPAGFAQAAPLAGFDAYNGWDQPLPSLLEFVSLEFPANSVASQYIDYGSRWDATPGVPVTPQQPPLTLTAAEGGSTLRALEHIRFEGWLTLIGDFTFEAPVIAHAPTAYVVSGGNLSLLATNQLDFQSGSRVDLTGGDLTLGGDLVEFGSDLAPSDPNNESGESMGSGSVLTFWEPLPIALPEVIWSAPLVTTPLFDTVPIWEPHYVSGSVVSGSVMTMASEVTLELSEFRPVPLPAALPLLVSGLGLLAARARRRG